jgi:hypothetical protein
MKVSANGEEMAKRKEVMEPLLRTNSTNIEWQEFSIWIVPRMIKKKNLIRLDIL